MLTKLTDSGVNYESTEGGLDLSEFLTFADAAERSVFSEHVCRRLVCHVKLSDVGGNADVGSLRAKTSD